MRRDLLLILAVVVCALPLVFIVADVAGTLVCDAATGLRCAGAVRTLLVR